MFAAKVYASGISTIVGSFVVLGIKATNELSLPKQRMSIRSNQMSLGRSVC